jgi:hypothetical protein
MRDPMTDPDGQDVGPRCVYCDALTSGVLRQRDARTPCCAACYEREQGDGPPGDAWRWRDDDDD